MLYAVLSAVLLQVAQAPPRDPSPPRDRTGTGVLSGRVVAADTGLPLRGVHVTLVPVSDHYSRQPRRVATDHDGRFEFGSLPAGTYRLGGLPGTSRGQYLGVALGARRPGETGRILELAEGQKIGQVTIALPRGGVIPGRVVDEYGEPLTRAVVFASRAISGGARFQRTATSTTDDHGRFRLFGLEPGEYVVGAESQRMGGPPVEGQSEGFATTYYPSALNEGEGTRVRVSAGSDAADVQIQLVRTRTFRITGTVIDSKGRTVMRPSLMLVRRSGTSGFISSFGPSHVEDGTFTIGNVVPGEYRLVVRPGRFGAPPPATDGERPEYAAIPLNVASDVHDVVVVTQPGVTVAGQIVFAEGAPPAPPAFEVRAAPADRELVFGPTAAANAGRDGRFALDELFGPRLIRTSGSSDYTLNAVMLGDTDITDVPVEFRPEHSGHLRVIVTSRASTLEGTVTDVTGAPAAEVLVLVIPEDRASWRLGSPRLRIASMREEGRFSAERVLAGRYYAIAVPRESVQLSPDTGPELFEELIRDATSVVIAEDETRTVDLRLVRR